jgi:hypothetical protein
MADDAGPHAKRLSRALGGHRLPLRVTLVRKRYVWATAGIVVIVALVAAWLAQSRREAAIAPSLPETSASADPPSWVMPASPPDPAPQSTLRPAPSSPPAPLAGDEATLMTRLRSAADADPALAIDLAREGDKRFPGSADAPERSSILIHALARQGRASEARGEAEAVVNEYPDSVWVREIEAFTGAHRHRSVRVVDGAVELY